MISSILVIWVAHLCSIVLADPALFSSATPSNNYIFPVFLDQALYFNVSASHASATDVSLVFQESAEMLSADPLCLSTPAANRTYCTPTYADNCSCQIVDMYSGTNLLRTNLVPTLGKVAFGTYGIIVRRYSPLQKMKICFQALWRCNPATDSARTNFSEQKCYYTSSGQLDPEFYPPRCVFIHVKQNPAVVSVLPLDSLKLVQTYTVTEGSRMPPWRRSIINSSVVLAVGEVLLLNVDAFDPNENDDVDVGVGFNSRLPYSAGLGLRQCCKDDFSSCEFRPFNFNQELDVNTTACTNNTNQGPSQPSQPVVISTCRTTCVRQAAPMPCRAVRRVFQFMATQDLVGQQFSQISFFASDNSGSLDSVKQGAGTRMCCRSSDLLSLVNVSVSIRVVDTAPAFLDPTPPHNFMLTAYVNCPIKAIGVYGFFSAGQALVPEGCVLGSVMTGEQTPCTAASVNCQCNPRWPAGMYATQPVAFAWRPFNFSSRMDRSVFNFKPITPGRTASSNITTVTVTLAANNIIPPGSNIILRNLMGGDDRGQGVNINFSNCGGFVNVTQVGQWDVASGTLRFGISFPMALLVLQFTVFGTVNTGNYSAEVDAPAVYSPFYWLTARYSITPGQQSLVRFCLRANILLPPGTAITIRNLKGMASSNSGVVSVTSSVLKTTGALDASSESLRVVTNSPTYGLSFSVTIIGPLSANSAAVEAAPDSLNEALYANVTIITTPMQQTIASAAACSVSEGSADALDGVPSVGTQRLLRWTPSRAQAGRTYNVCMRLASRAGPSSALRCFKIKVEKCKHCILMGETWATLAALYTTDWLQLWSANAGAPVSPVWGSTGFDGTNPDLLAPGNVVRLGVLYKTRTSGGYLDLAHHYGTTQESLLAANPEMADLAPVGPVSAGGPSLVPAGYEVCLLPPVCRSNLALDGSVSPPTAL